MEEEKRTSSDLTPPAPPPPAAESKALGTRTYIKPQHRKPHDNTVTFEEYHYYAHKTREEEQGLESVSTSWREIVLRKKKAHNITSADGDAPTVDPKTDFSHRLEITDEEWTNASRAFRTAGWGACE